MSNIELIYGDCLEQMKTIKEGSVDLILTDPPYVKMVSESWDRLSDIEAKIFFNSLKKESQRILRFGGRFICFSSNDTLRYLYGEEFLHRELLVVSKDVKKVAAGRNTKQYKQHINAVEYVFVATKFAREYVKFLLLNVKGDLTAKEINTKLGLATNGGGMWSIYTGQNICQQVPTKKQWQKFRNIFSGLPEYETFEEVFHNSLGKGNVLSGFNFNIKNRVHPTQKPLTLIEYLIQTYSNKNDLILDCCAGSGTTGIACKNLERNFIGIEINEKYFKIAKNLLI